MGVLSRNVCFDLYCTFILKSGNSPNYHLLHPHHLALELIRKNFPQMTCLCTFRRIATFRSQRHVQFVIINVTLSHYWIILCPSPKTQHGFWKQTLLISFCSGGWIWTTDLRVMGPTSYLCSTPLFLKVSIYVTFWLNYVFFLAYPTFCRVNPPPIVLLRRTSHTNSLWVIRTETLNLLAGTVGFEPTTITLTGCRSTSWAMFPITNTCYQTGGTRGLEPLVSNVRKVVDVLPH